MNTVVRRFALFLALAAAIVPLRAQSWDVVRGLRAGERVKVSEKGGTEHKGKVSAVTPEALSIEGAKGPVSIERARVRRVEVHTPSRRARNIAIGAGIGAAVGLVADNTLGAYLRNESAESGAARAVTYLAGIGIFGAIGAALSPYRTIYKAK